MTIPPQFEHQAGPARGMAQQPNPQHPPGPSSGPAPATSQQTLRARRRKRTWIAVVAATAVLIVGATVLVVAPWKQKQVKFPTMIGPVTSVSWSTPSSWLGAPYVWGVLPYEARWVAYADATDKYPTYTRPLNVVAAVFDSRNPAVTVNDILIALQGSTTLRLSLTDVHSVSANPGATWDEAHCGQQIGKLPPDPEINSHHVPYTRIVVCAWADSDIAGAAFFLNRDVGDSEDLLRMIQATATVVRV